MSEIFWTSCPPTRGIYHDDPYRTTATAIVLAAEGNEAVFDQSIFYPESGGQVADQGTVNGKRVTDVQKAGGKPFQLPNGEAATVDAVFRHFFEEDCGLAEGEPVDMEIDWDRRYRNMQMHTLAHFLFHSTGEYLESHGLRRATQGCFISDNSARFDFNSNIPSEAVEPIRERIADLLANSGEAEVTPLEGTHDVFIWRSGDIVIPCGGTHVRHPKEIRGAITVRRRLKGKGLTRLYVELDRSAT
jgi:alanyl-tRNA synthetase